MNKHYRLTNDSKFSTVMKAATEFGISVFLIGDIHNSTPVRIVWKENDRLWDTDTTISEVPEAIQRIIDKITNRKEIL